MTRPFNLEVSIMGDFSKNSFSFSMTLENSELHFSRDSNVLNIGDLKVSGFDKIWGEECWIDNSILSTCFPMV